MSNFIDPDVIDLDEGLGLGGDSIELEEGGRVEMPVSSMQYPCVLIEDMMFEREVQFVNNLEKEEDALLPFYIDKEGPIEGYITVSVDNILKIKALGCRATLFLPDGHPRDLFDSSVLINFIRL